MCCNIFPLSSLPPTLLPSLSPSFLPSLLLSLPALSDKASRLSLSSKKYLQEARYLNLRASMTAIIVLILVVLFFLIFIRYWLF